MPRLTTSQLYAKRAEANAARHAETSNKRLHGTRLRRKAYPMRNHPLVLKPDHPAIVEQRTLFPKSVVDTSRLDPATAPAVLKSGVNSPKIGKTVMKGWLKGAPIYTLTLEERRTCPSSCGHWLDCYGNKMHWAPRHSYSPRLLTLIERDLAALQRRHPGGFVVRPHILGEFMSVEYVRRWGRWLGMFPALHCFGFTARRRDDPIGAEVMALAAEFPDRWWFRQSGYLGRWGSITVREEQDAPIGSIVCPAQTGRTECCATCGLCWSTDRNIAFLGH